MEKRKKISLAGILISVLCMGFAGCGKHVEPEIPEVGTPPVQASEEMIAFFAEYLQFRYDDDGFQQLPELFEDYAKEEEVCLINSVDEFRAIAPSGTELPEIDFDKYTVLIAHYLSESGYYDKQGIDTEPDAMILNLVRYYKRGELHVFEPSWSQRLYWGLYPKLPQKPVVIYDRKEFI